jgi:hypothetical protein
MHFTATIIGAVLLVTFAGLAPAAGEDGQGDCGISNPNGKITSQVTVIQKRRRREKS